MVLLLVEDNPRLAASLIRGLGEDGFDIAAVQTGQAALDRIAAQDIDAVVLDLGLPDMDGLDVLDAVRRVGHWVPVLVLTARDALASRLDALDRGADDYLVKPFAYAELLARIRALVRRAAGPRWAPLAAGGLTIAVGEPSVRIGDTVIALSPREHGLLVYLMRRRGEVLSRAELLREVFDYDFNPGTNLVDVHIANLRRKLGDSGAAIETIRGIGYRFGADPTQATHAIEALDV